MDALFEFFFPADFSLESLGFKVQMFEWQGVQYPQGLGECTFGTNFKLKVSEEGSSQYIKNKLPVKYKQINWQLIEILGDGLDKYVASIHGFGEEEIGFSLQDMLYFFLKDSPAWLVAFSPEYDGFTKVTRGNIEDVLSTLEHEIGKLDGFLIYHLPV